MSTSHYYGRLHGPTHSYHPNENHTTANATNPKTAVSAITDPDFLPTLDEAPTTQHFRSRLLLRLPLLVEGAFSAWFMGFELFLSINPGVFWLWISELFSQLEQKCSIGREVITLTGVGLLLGTCG